MSEDKEKEKAGEFTCPIRAFHETVVLKMTPRELEGGLVLSEDAKTKDRSAVVMTVGPDVKEIEVGMHILYAQLRAFTPWKDPRNGNEYMMVHWKDIMCEITDKKLSAVYGLKVKSSPSQIINPKIAIPGRSNTGTVNVLKAPTKGKRH